MRTLVSICIESVQHTEEFQIQFSCFHHSQDEVYAHEGDSLQLSTYRIHGQDNEDTTYTSGQ